MKKIIAITTTFNGEKKYVTDHFKKADHTFIVAGTSTDPNDAYDFKTKKDAKAVLIRLNNPFNRQYDIEEVKVEKKSSFVEPDFNLN